MDHAEPSGPPGDAEPRKFPSSEEPTPVTPLGTASLWRRYLQDPQRHKSELDRLVVKPESWGDFSGVAATMRRLSLTDFPVTVSGRSPDVAYVRLAVSRRESGSAAAHADWFLTTVRGIDGWWRVWDLTKDRRPPAWEIFG